MIAAVAGRLSEIGCGLEKDVVGEKGPQRIDFYVTQRCLYRCVAESWCPAMATREGRWGTKSMAAVPSRRFSGKSGRTNRSEVKSNKAKKTTTIRGLRQASNLIN